VFANCNAPKLGDSIRSDSEGQFRVDYSQR
jgi:hypothetical protein